MPLWKPESHLVGGIIYAVLVVCLGDKRAERWFPGVVLALVAVGCLVTGVLVTVCIFAAI